MVKTRILLICALLAFCFIPAGISQENPMGVIPYHELDGIPQVEQKGLLIFPRTIKELAIPGLVKIWVSVASDGSVDRLRVIQSTHPHFSECAIDLLLGTRFSPPRHQGNPVKTGFPIQVRFPPTEQSRLYDEHLRYQVITAEDPEPSHESSLSETQPLLFFIAETGEMDTTYIHRQGSQGFALQEMKSASSIFNFKPSIEEGPLAYDTAPLVSRFSIPVFPTEYLLKGQGRQKVTVTWFVDPKGMPFDPTADEDSAYGRSMEAAIRYWTFTPAQLEEKPVLTALAYTYSFNRFRMESELRRTAQQIARGNIQLRAPSEMDRPLRPRVIQDIIYPRMPEKASGYAVIKVVVNPEGRIILPEIEETDNEDLAWSVIAGLSQWRFDPPIVNDEPAYIVFQQRFQNQM